MTDAITVTAIVPTYNRADLLAQALDSILAQTRPVDELIVIDDASSDHTEALAARYGERVRYVRNLTNSGKPASLNFAIPLARGSHIWIFDDDDVALPEALANHVAYLAANPTIDFSYSDKYIFDDAGGDIWQRDRWRIDRLPRLGPEDFFQRTLYAMNTLFQGMLVPARCYRVAGAFDETLDRCEDHDMLLRLARFFCAGNMGQASFVYRHHAGVRGSGSLQHAGDARYRVLLDYRQRVFRRLRRDCPLAAFTPRAHREGEFASASSTLATVQRGCVMLHHGLVDEALADLAEALPDVARADFEHADLRAMLGRATHIEAWTWPHGRRDLARLARTLAAARAVGLDTAFARGLYWQFRSDWRRRNTRASVSLLRLLTAFVARCRYHRLRGAG